MKAPAVPGLTEALVGTSEAQRNVAFTRLETAKLLTVNRDAAGTLISLDAHPLLREYFARQLRTQQSEAWRAAHRRLYEHLCASTKEGDQPTLEDLQPLYQAVAHGCQAGLQQETFTVLDRRIGQLNEKYPTRKLGAFGSELGGVACFFDQPWGHVSPALKETRQHTWLLATAAFDLRALGRLTEAIEPMRAGLLLELKREDWKNAAIIASNLSELELTLGEVAAAVGDAEQSVTYADRSGDAFQRMSKRTTHADALQQAGRRAEAEARFREAEQMQAEGEPASLLYSLQGFQYCDLLLTEAERAAWQLLLNPKSTVRNPKLGEACRAVCERAAQTLKWAESQSLVAPLEVALDHLTLGSAALSAFVLDPSAIRNRQSAIDNLQAAVAGLRRAGQQHLLVLGLLTRAWLRFLTGARTGPESAQSDLDEAWDFAERGPMPLFMADIHLHRARLFFREAKYPWGAPQVDLTESRRLIEKHGYLRRIPELQDAEEAMLR